MNLTNLTTNLQVEISNYLRKFQVRLKKPEFKFINNGLNGMLRSKSIFISNISLHLHEKIDKKKIEERLLYHLAKEEMFTKLTTSYLEGNSKDIRKQKYIVLDGSAIRKDYAKKMEGLCLVYDGASKKKNKIEIGYHWDNIVGVSRTADGEIHIFPIYSEIYSKDIDPFFNKSSENSKILSIHEKLQPYFALDSIFVMDRGYDRMRLIEPFIERNQNFIIRQTGRRYLIDIMNNENISVKELSRKTKLKYSYTVDQIKNGRKLKRIFRAGAVKVKFPNCKSDKCLWLVTAQEKGKGKTWFLSYLETDNVQEAIMTTMEGYKYRWKVEEFHRQVKQDYNLNKIKVMKYNTIKSVGALLLITMGFVAKLFNMVSKKTKMKILNLVNLIYKRCGNNLPVYIYYKATEAIRLLLNIFFKRRKHKKEVNFSYNNQPLLDL
ncbi:MAG: transposase [Bacteroidales bacterium]|nr:transposase [Bacteroidales bacterium]